MLATFTAPLLVALAAEATASSLMRKCVVSKLLEVSDGACETLWAMSRLGFATSKNVITKPLLRGNAKTQLMEMTKFTDKVDSKEFTKLRENLAIRSEYQEILALNFEAEVYLVAAILREVQEKFGCKEPDPVSFAAPIQRVEGEEQLSTTNIVPTETVIIAEYLSNPTQHHFCHSPLCQSESLRTSLFILQSTFRSIHHQLQKIEAENLRFQACYVGFLCDKLYFDRLKLLVPLLKENKDNFLKMIQLFVFVENHVDK